MGDEVIHDPLAEGKRRCGGISAEKGNPVGIIPADTRFRFFGSEQVVTILGCHLGCFHRCHQAGVKPDHIKGDAALCQCLVNTVERHGSGALELLVIPIPCDGAAAVIPQDQHVAVRGIVLCTETDKLRECGRCDHRLVTDVVVEQTELTAVFNFINLVGSAADKIILPLGTAAGIDNDVYIVSDLGICHFLKILRCHGVIGLQVSTTHEHHDGDRIGTVAFDGSKFWSCTVRHGVVLRAGVAAATPGRGGVGTVVHRRIAAEECAEVKPCAAGPVAKATAVVGKIAVAGEAARVTGRARQGGRRSRNRGGTRRRCRCWTRCRRRRRTRSWCSRGNDGVVRAAVVLSCIHQTAAAGPEQGHDNKKNHDNTDNAAKAAASLPIALFAQQQVGKCCQKKAVSAGAGRIDRSSFPIVVRSVRAAAARTGSAGRSGTSALGIAARPPGISSRAPYRTAAKAFALLLSFFACALVISCHTLTS